MAGFGFQGFSQPFGGLRGASRGPRPLVSVGRFGHVNLPNFLHPQAPKGPSNNRGSGSSGGAPVQGGRPPGAGQQSPLDAQYFQNVAENQFKVNNQINSLNEQSANNQTALQAALAQLSHQQPLDQLKLEQAANARGALYSSGYGQQLGQLNYGYLGREGGLQEQAAQRQAAIASQIAALQQGEGLFDQGQYEQAVERAATMAQKNPALGMSAGPLANRGGRGRNGPVRPQRTRSRLAQAIARGRSGGF